MSADASWPLQQAVYQALTDDTALTTLLGGARVYDRVPRDASLPYITIGEAIWRDWSTSTEAGSEHTLLLHIWTAEDGRKLAKQCAAAIHAVLHDASLAVTGATLVNLRFQTAQILTDPDGETWHTVLRYRAVAETA